MKVVLYQQVFEEADSINQFLDSLYIKKMNFLASDLLNKGLSPLEISHAIRRAMRAMKASSANVKQHFMPVYTQGLDGVIKDCKLSRLGYAMVLLNANPNNQAVGEWQLQVIQHFFTQ